MTFATAQAALDYLLKHPGCGTVYVRPPK